MPCHTLSDILLALIAMHLLANIFYAFILKINLTKPMITGKKRLNGELSGVETVKERPVAAIICALLAVAVSYYVFL